MSAERRTRAGFTLIEVLIALAVLGIALVVLLHCQLVSIMLSDRAGQLTRATLLAETRIAERLAAGYPEPGVEEGTEEGDGAPMRWTVRVAPVEPADLPEAAPAEAELRSLRVEVTWRDGRDERRVTLSTYVAPRERGGDEAI
jgi:general secretion pathway protein I